MSRGSIVVDQFGQEVSGNVESLAVWDAAVLDLMGMRGDPMTPLDEAASADESFVLGSVFTGSYRIVGAGIPTGPEIQQDLERVRQRRDEASEHEQAHIAAFESLAAGEFSHAAAQWDQIVRDHPRDLVAARIAHDVYLHVGDIDDRLTSAERAMQPWNPGEAGYGWVMGIYSFGLEEAGRHDEAEQAGRIALEENPTDCWALHSLAHTYEHLDAHEEAIELLRANEHWWTESDLLGGHVWWHLALRLIESGDYDEALAIAEDLAEGKTAFRLADITSLLWRLELDGQEVGDQWDPLIQHWSESKNLHTSAFIDMHAAMAFATAGSTPDAERFWAGVESPHYGQSENGRLLQGTVHDLLSAIREFRDGNSAACEQQFQLVENDLQQIGGSLAQREVLTRTRVKNLMESDPKAAASYLNQLQAADPTRVWMQRAQDSLTEQRER